MKYTTAKGIKMSVFTLGTVQLGMAYGINNIDGKPTEATAFDILNKAVKLGVNSLDTANNYGDSEAIIGKWLGIKPCEVHPMVITKIGPFDHSSYASLHADVRRQVNESKKRLGVSQLDILMLHNFADYEKDREALQKIFQELKDSGEIKFSAISAYSEHDYKDIANSGFDAVQIPLNLFDWAQIDNGGVQKLVDAGMIIFVRSVFLQGLIFRTPESLDPRMDFCAPYLAKLHELCDEFRLSPAVLALSFPLSIKGIAAVVLGCDNSAQVEENCRLIDQTVQLSENQLKKLHTAFMDIDYRVINPREWYNAF